MHKSTTKSENLEAPHTSTFHSNHFVNALRILSEAPWKFDLQTLSIIEANCQMIEIFKSSSQK